MKLRCQSKSRRGRTFEVELMGSIHANTLWGAGDSKAHRPVYLAFASTHEAVRAFSANLRIRRRAVVVSRHGREEAQIELLKSVVYRWQQRRTPDGLTICEVFMPEVVALDPGAVGDRVKGLVMVPTWWVDRQVAFFEDYPAERRRELVVATWFAAFVDHRVDVPIYRDPAYYLALWRKFKRSGGYFQPEPACSWNTSRFTVFPAEPAGFEEIALVNVDTTALTDFINNVLQETFAHGTTRLPSSRRLLSHA